MASPEESLRRVLAEKQAAVETLKALKVEAGASARRLQAAVSSSGNGSAEGSREAFRQAIVNTLERRLFYIPSFKIYRGVAGLYDYVPPGCAVKSNVLAFWRQVNNRSFIYIVTYLICLSLGKCTWIEYLKCRIMVVWLKLQKES